MSWLEITEKTLLILTVLRLLRGLGVATLLQALAGRAPNCPEEGCLGLSTKTVSLVLLFHFSWHFCLCFLFVSVWTEETQCTLLNASITETFNCSFSCGPDCWKTSQYPCLQVYVNVSFSGQKCLLYHTEETMKINAEVRTNSSTIQSPKG